MQRFIKLFAVLSFLVMSTTVNAQVTGTRLINKATLTSGNYSGTLTYLYTDRTGTDIGIRKVTAPDILDFAGLGLTDVATFGGAILNGNLTVTGTSVLTGTLAVNNAITTTGRFDIINGGNAFVGGADTSGTVRTNNTAKDFRIAAAHYGNAELPVCLVRAIPGAGSNQVLWGGGTAALNAVTLHAWYTTTTTTGGAGSERMRLTSSGFLGIGTTPAYTLDVRATDTGSQLHIGTVTGTDSGIYQYWSGGAAYYFANMSYNGSQYVAKATSACGLGYAPTLVNFTSNSGLTPGTTFTPTSIWQIGSAAGTHTYFNETGLDTDFRIEGDNEANLFALDAGLDRIGIATATPNATLHVSGSFATAFRDIAASGNITATDHFITTTGTITTTLPSAVSLTGREYILKNKGVGTITVGSLGGTIDGSTTATIVTGTGVLSSMKFKSDGTNWHVTY